jgi:hypothetical protein
VLLRQHRPDQAHHGIAVGEVLLQSWGSRKTGVK